MKFNFFSQAQSWNDGNGVVLLLAVMVIWAYSDLNIAFFTIVFKNTFTAYNVKHLGHVMVKILGSHLSRTKNDSCNLIQVRYLASFDNHLSEKCPADQSHLQVFERFHDLCFAITFFSIPFP